MKYFGIFYRVISIMEKSLMFNNNNQSVITGLWRPLLHALKFL